METRHGDQTRPDQTPLLDLALVPLLIEPLRYPLPIVVRRENMTSELILVTEQY